MNARVLALAILPLTLVLGCAADASDDGEEATGAAADELVARNQCSAGTWNGFPLSAVVELDRTNGRYIYVTFHGVPYTVSNNAFVKLVHPDGSWVYYQTSDNIVNGQRTRAFLNWKDASGSIVTSVVGPGDVLRVKLVFDLPNTSDKACSTYLAW